MRIDDHITDEIKSVGIAGHVNPDGDCVGSCCALRRYLIVNYPQLEVDLYLEEPEAGLLLADGADKAMDGVSEDRIYDPFIVCDVSDRVRVAVASDLFAAASRTLCVDHHASNEGFADTDIIDSQASSTCELLYTLLDPSKIDAKTAEALYMGIVHDSGAFQYRNTSPRTMRIAADLMEWDFDPSAVIEKTFTGRTFVQNKVTGCVLEKSELFENGRGIFSSLTIDEMDRYGANLADTSMIVSDLRITKGIDIAIFLYEVERDVFKVSLRSGLDMDVSAIAKSFGGGGHIRAAGCTLPYPHDVAKEMIMTAAVKALADYKRAEA